MAKIEKKVVGRNVAIALGIICIILAVGLVGAIANYTLIISGKDNTIANINSEITNDNSTIASLYSQTQTLTNQNNQLQTWLNGNVTLLQTWLNGNVTLLQTWLNGNVTLLNDFANTVNLNKSTVMVNSQTVNQSANSYSSWYFSGDAGFVSVDVQSSTTTNTYVQVVWTYIGTSLSLKPPTPVSYDNTITVGASGIASFPVLGTPDFQVRVGNTNVNNGATETVTITYYY